MTDDAGRLYEALLNSGRLPRLRRLTYRCALERCTLLDAVETPLGTVLHQTRYKFSDAVNERRSNAQGRAKNTFDGAEHWRPRTYWLSSSALAYPDDRPPPRLAVQCDHVGVMPDGSELHITAPEFRDYWAAGRAEVRVRADGSRYAVD